MLPTSPKDRVLSLDLDNTKCIGSSAGPIMCRFFSANFISDFICKYAKRKTISFFFFSDDVTCRSGDEIAQDELVMLIGGLMNQVFFLLLKCFFLFWICQIWAKQGIGARLVTFRAVSVGKKVGLIEVVSNCTSLGKVQNHSLTGAFQRSAIRDWLEVKSVANELFILFSNCVCFTGESPGQDHVD